MSACGIVLAAGAGSRFGGPKALAREPDGSSWLVRAVRALADGGCAPVLVALGAAPEAAALLPDGLADVVVGPVPDWADGLSASLRASLAAAGGTGATAAVVIPVDAPALPASAVRRLVAVAAPDALARATYRGEPGHPALIGRGHWCALSAAVSGDRGAARYLTAHRAAAVACDDLWSGEDVDSR